MDKRNKIKIAILSEPYGNNANHVEYLKDKLEQEGKMQVSCLIYPPNERGDIIGQLKTLQPDLLITTDLQGFEQRTLTDNIAFNLADCKQLHLLLHKNLPNESYLGKQLSIAMFFYCAGNAYYDELSSRYPDLPYLKQLEGWQDAAGKQAMEQNAAILCSVIKEVLNA